MASDTVQRVLFADATKVTKLDSHVYKINLNHTFCIGSVPNGGYTASCMLAAASLHLLSSGQVDALTAHFEYPSRTMAEPAIIIIEDVKLGPQLSTLHMALWQGGLLTHAPWITPSISRRTVVSYTTHTKLPTFTGISVPTGYEATPAALLPPLPNFEKLKINGADSDWEKSKLPKPSGHWRSQSNWDFYLPRGDTQTPGVLDMWIHMASGENIKQRTLPYVVDSFPHNLHTFMVAPELRQLLAAPEDRADKTRKGETEEEDQPTGLWFPTIVMNLEIKMALPDEGVEWLAMRVTSKQIKDGRFDLDVLVRNLDGELIALSHHVAMIVIIERNMKGRRQGVKSTL